jgi:DNA modification methylase
MTTQEIIVGDCREVLRSLPENHYQVCCTSPPYWQLRRYTDGDPNELGSEPTPEEFIATMVDVFREVRRVLREDGVAFVNMGDGYAGSGPPGGPGKQDTNVGSRGITAAAIPKGLKPKDLIGMPWRLALALQADGWWLRSDIIWHKPNPMPESCTDRPTKAHEYIFMLTKRAKYFYDAEAVREAGPTYTRKAGGYDKHHEQGASRFGGKGGFSDSDVTTTGRNLRTVWTIPTQSFSEAHFATYPEALVAPCLKAGTSLKGCCPSCGAPWRRVVEKEGGRGHDWNANNRAGGNRLAVGQSASDSAPEITRTTLGWQPGCECRGHCTCDFDGEHAGDCYFNEVLPPVPCRVLDIFSGSGTSGVVCRKMGLDYTGIELNPEYAAMAEKRIANCMNEKRPVVKDVPGQMELIAEEPCSQPAE